MIRYKQFLLMIATSLTVGTVMTGKVIAEPIGCLNFSGLRNSNGWYQFMLLDRNDTSPKRDARINIREQPTTSSSVVDVASSRNTVAVSEQVVGEDGYCWARVKITIYNGNPRQVLGWVRGDFVSNWRD